MALFSPELYEFLISGFYRVFFLIIGLFGIGFLIGFHELGHFLFCKLFQVRTPSFSIGMGPRLIQKKIGDTNFVLSAIPLGGYVEIAGAADESSEPVELRTPDKYSFAKKPYYQKMAILAGGILFNLIFAYAAFTLVFMLGLPKSEIMYPTNALTVIETVAKDSAAERAGIQSGDKILAVNGIPTENKVSTIIDLVQPHAKQEITLQVERDSAQQSLIVIPDEKNVLGKTVGSLGVSFVISETDGVSLFSAIRHGFNHANSIIINTFQAFRHIFSKGDVSQMAGPVMLISATAKGAGKGFRIFLIFLAIISINLAILNLIPLPILDGGQALFYTIEAIMGKSLSHKIKEYIHIASWLMILALTLYLSYKDILRIFSFRIFGS